MATWWLALGSQGEWTSYAEIKARKVIAQGFRDFGDLTPLLPFVVGSRNFREEKESRQREFHQEIARLAQLTYQVEMESMYNLWNLMWIHSGDLIVAREGRVVVGVCQATQNAWQSYRYDPAFEAAQTVSHPVEWVDWDCLQAGEPPVSPAQVAGIIPLVGAQDRLIQAWVSYVERKLRPSDEGTIDA